MYKAHIGMTFWKAKILPAVCWTNSEIKELDSIQFRIAKSLLNLPRHTSREYIQGELGFSGHYYRDAKNKLQMLQHIINNTTQLKQIIFQSWNHTDHKWIQKCKLYMTEFNITVNDLQNEDRSQQS